MATGYLSTAQLQQVYTAVKKAHYTAAGSTFTLHHTTNILPITPDPLQPFDIPPVGAITTTAIPLRSMVGVKADDAQWGKVGEIIECDLRLYAWQEEMETAGLRTSTSELDLLTKDIITYEGEIFSILKCEPCMPFFGASRTVGVNPTPVYDRNFLAVKFTCERLDRARD